ncbi:hypothetical protein VTO42DRAFT_6525 [Malbranchea cinnamomea]
MSVSTRSEDETPEVLRPKRTQRACDSCYKRKIKCDAAVPQCNWCHHHDLPCTFTRVTRRSRKQKLQPPSDHLLSQRVERIEKLLAERLAPPETGTAPVHYAGSHVPTNPTVIHPNPGVFPQANRPYFGQVHFAGLRIGDINSCHGVPLFSPEGARWVQSRTGQEVNLERICPFSGLLWQSQQPFYLSTGSKDLMMSGTAGLPDVRLVKEYVSTYGRSFIRAVFPFIDPVLFEDTIRLAYQPPAGSQAPHGTISAKACVCSFIAIAALNLQEHVGPPLDSENYAWKAQSLFPLVSLETTLDGLQACIMLLVFHMLSGNLQAAVFLRSYTSGFIYMLGAHTRIPPPSDPSYPELQRRRDLQLRNLFWVFYTLDKELSLRTGQPPALNDDHCDLTLPPNYGKDMDIYTRVRPISCEELIEFPLVGDIRLSRIKYKVYTMLYSAGALQKSDAELLKSIRELDNELETWRVSLPPQCRPTLSFSKGAPVADSDISMHTLMLRLEYHHCMATIHQASGRCVAWTGNQTGVMEEGVRSSFALSVQASRSSLFYLQTALHVLRADSFWLVLFYPMSAVLTLFCNIILNPLDTQAPEDLELLSSVPALIRALPVRQLTVNEVMHIKRVDDFVAELGRLAKCAVMKAREC